MKRFMLSLALAGALIISGTPQHTAHADDTTIGTIIGAVGGGLLGSAAGKGKGRIVATAAGTVIGAVLGHEIAKGQSNDDYYDRPRRRVYDDNYERERVVYRKSPPRKKVVIVEERPRKNKKWHRVGSYDDDVLICNKKGKRCHW
ncbi:MAG: glycine zipper 2TM domain-containing protein [Methylocystaceae bacterium]|nr:glycine zipper 2TM domain-containing protein [Methylocystaceae bacterium]